MKNFILILLLVLSFALYSCENQETPEKNELDNIIVEDETFEYDGEEKFLYFVGELPEGVTFSWENNMQTEVGVYTVTLKLFKDGNVIKEITKTLTITSPGGSITPDVSGITLSDYSFEYDGENHSLSYAGVLPSGVTTEWVNNVKKEVGEYTVTLKLLYEGQVIKELSAKLTITEKSGDSHNADLPWV